MFFKGFSATWYFVIIILQMTTQTRSLSMNTRMEKCISAKHSISPMSRRRSGSNTSAVIGLYRNGSKAIKRQCCPPRALSITRRSSQLSSSLRILCQRYIRLWSSDITKKDRSPLVEVSVFCC